MKDEYIEQVLNQIKKKSAKELIAQELESHLADKIDYYTDVGYSPEDAEQKAVEDMGSPDEAAVPLGSLYNIKWYKKFELWLGALLVAIHVYLMIFFPNNFKYTSSDFAIIHFISIDFVSLLIFALDLYLIHLMRKQHNTLLLLPIAASLIMGFFSHALEPSLYAAAVICSKGVGAYIDSIFGYSYTFYTLYNTRSVVHILSIAVTAVLLILSLCTAYIVYSEQLCRNVKKAKKLLCIAEKVLICFLTVNLAVMGTGTVIALVTLDDKLEENYTTRKDMIDFYINFDNSKSSDELIAEFDKNGYKYIPMSSDYQGYVYNKDNAAFVFYDTDFNYNAYAVTTIGVNSVLNRDMFIDESEFDRFKRNMKDLAEQKAAESGLVGVISEHYYENEQAPEDYYDSTAMEEQSKLPPEERPYTLEEFSNDKIYANASLVSSKYPDTYGNAEIYEFRYMLKNSKHKEVTLEFFGGMLTNMTFTEY